MRMLIKEDAGRNGRASFAGRSFDSVHLNGLRGLFQGSPVIQYTHLACLKVDLWFVFAINGLFLCFTE